DGINLDINQGFYAVNRSIWKRKIYFITVARRPSVSPDEGKIQVEDIDLSKFDEESLAIFRRRNIGFIFRQLDNLIPVLNVHENIYISIRTGWKKCRQRIYSSDYTFIRSGGKINDVS
ncbi:MAG: hypothetical protein ACLVAT_08035, partial [Lachnospiraceae bacterium]